VLAKKYYNDTRKVSYIEKANPNVNPKRIQIGDKIKVPNLNKTNNTSTETNTSSNTNSAEPNRNKGLGGWKKSTSTDECKKAEDDNNRTTHPFGRQEQPSVPDDENVGTLVKVVIREKTTHIASPGDSAIGLALQYYGSYNLKTLIEKANPYFDWYNIKCGDTIVIPEYSEMKVKSPTPENDLSQKRDESAGEPVIEERSKRKESTEFEVYTVKKGESLWVIAQKKLGNGTRYREIMKLNNMTSDVVNEGMRIKIPKR
ncbi:MAG: LysM peptidoglycan-binding domain-containing protein, partial [Candidatus Heimdallarchaeota archaeon]|nr:LysM peptidoglycan-binding domain-containing protein [Candidatus Heimdallarchaeota archaeon]